MLFWWRCQFRNTTINQISQYFRASFTFTTLSIKVVPSLYFKIELSWWPMHTCILSSTPNLDAFSGVLAIYYVIDKHATQLSPARHRTYFKNSDWNPWAGPNLLIASPQPCKIQSKAQSISQNVQTRHWKHILIPLHYHRQMSEVHCSMVIN